MSEYSLRDCGQAVIRAVAQAGRDEDMLRAGLLDAVLPLMERDDLLTLGARRPGNHIDNSKYLYYDGQLSITLDEFPKGKVIPPHDHGVWEALVLYKGRLRHSVYERVDDGSVEGFAELRTIDDREFTPHEVAMVVPPTEIHSFTALAEGTYVVTVVGGNYKPVRHYYDVEKKSYVVSVPREMRPAAPAS